MSITSPRDGTKEVTLAIELSACQRLTDPGAVFADARDWSRYIGVIANDVEAIATFIHEEGLEQDFELGDRDKWLALQDLRMESDTQRHVYVGVTEEDQRMAEQTGWEFIHLAEAAERAGWDLTDDRPGVLAIVERLLACIFR